LRELKIVASAQLRWPLEDEPGDGRWEELPEATRVSVLGLLARLIAKGVVDDEEDDSED
jgi:hypothetical protein